MLKRVFLGLTVITGVLLTSGLAQGQNQIEATNPKFEGIEVRMLEDNFLTRTLSVEGLRLHAYGGELILADDNIYNATSDNEDGDTIWLTLAGSKLTYANNLLELNLSGQYRDWNYDQADTADYEDYAIKGDVSFDMSEMLEIRVGGGTEKRVNPLDPGVVGQALSEVEYTVDSANAGVTLTPDSRYGAALDWRFKDWTYEDVFSGNDYDETSLALSPYYNLSPNTRLTVEALYGETNVDDPNARDETTYLGGQVGVLHRLTEKMAATVKAGYQDRDYDNVASPGDDDYGDFIGSAALTYTPTELIETKLSVSKTAQEATSYHYYELLRMAASATYMPMDPLKLTLKLTRDDVEPSRAAIEESEIYGGQLAVTYALNEFLTVGGSYKYTKADSDDAGREYERNIAGIGAWLTF